MTKIFNEIYRSYVANQYPFVVADFKIPTGRYLRTSGRRGHGLSGCVLSLRHFVDSYDVNVSPDKRTIFLHNERKLVEMIMVRTKYLCMKY